MNTVTFEMTLPQPIYLALQSAGLNREKLRERALRNLAIQLYADDVDTVRRFGGSKTETK